MPTLNSFINYSAADYTVKLNAVNRFLSNTYNAAIDSYRSSSVSPIPADYLRWTLCIVGMKEDYLHGEAFRSLTQEIDPRSYQEATQWVDKEDISSNGRTVPLIYGTGIVYHDRAFGEINGMEQKFANYTYTDTCTLDDLPEVTFEQTKTSLSISQDITTTTAGSETFGTFLEAMCGKEIDGDYPHRMVFAGNLRAFYDAIGEIEHTKGPYASFSDISAGLAGILEDAEYSPNKFSGIDYGLAGTGELTEPTPTETTSAKNTFLDYFSPLKLV